MIRDFGEISVLIVFTIVNTGKIDSSVFSRGYMSNFDTLIVQIQIKEKTDSFVGCKQFIIESN